MRSPAEISGDILLRLVLAVLLLILVPLGIVGLLIVSVVDVIGDSRAWAAFAKVWWGGAR